jgi:hypothetical protein
MNKLFLGLLLLAAGGAAYWNFGMGPSEREWARAKVRAIPEWNPLGY